MKAWQYNTYGPPAQVLRLETAAKTPELVKEDDCLVEVKFAALNPVDVKIMQSRAAQLAVTRKPVTFGLDFAGRVVKAGGAVTRVRVGDWVYGRQQSLRAFRSSAGSCAEFMVISHQLVARIDSHAARQMAGLAGAGEAALVCLAYGDIREHGVVGRRVLIHGASGGVGSLAVQIAKTYGAYVAAVCSSRNTDFVKSLGADEVIDYTAIDLVDYVSASYKRHPFDLVVDNVGTRALFYASHSFTTPAATFVTVAGDIDVSSFASLLSKQFLPGFLGGGQRRHVFLSAPVTTASLDTLESLVAEGKLAVHVDREFACEEVVDAAEYVRKGHTRGKVVVCIS